MCPKLARGGRARARIAHHLQTNRTDLRKTRYSGGGRGHQSEGRQEWGTDFSTVDKWTQKYGGRKKNALKKFPLIKTPSFYLQKFW